MTRQIKIALDELHAMRERVQRHELIDADWLLLGVLVDRFVDQTEARHRKMKDKAAERAASTTENTQDADSADSAARGPVIDAEFAEVDNEQGACAPSEGGASCTRPSSDSCDGDSGDATAADPLGGEKPKKNHGRKGKSAFAGATKHVHAFTHAVVGMLCAACGVGRMTRYREKVIIRIVGQSLLGAEAHHFAQALCRSCGAIVRAEGQEEVLSGVGSEYITYGWSACATVAVMHYFAGMPFKRIEGMQEGWQVPVPDANQWRIVDEADDLLGPLYKALERHGIRNATGLRIDDTGAKIIEVQRKIRAERAMLERLGESTASLRTGINATGVYLDTDASPVVLFFTGRHHAGEVIDRLLEHRRANDKKLVKVTDGASKNFDHAHEDELEEAVCNAHAYLKFRPAKDQFPEECALAGEVYKAVFDNDDKAKAMGLDPVERMAFHRECSRPQMERLRQKCAALLESRSVEPTSTLWAPVNFIINQWPLLTKFCEVPGVPLDTNVVEQTLIIPVRYLAASFNYKTKVGAEVGDRFMSLVATANAAGVAPIAYVTHCLENHEHLAKEPEHYLPWAYKDRLGASPSTAARVAPPASAPQDPPTRAPPPAPGLRTPHPLTIGRAGPERPAPASS